MKRIFIMFLTLATVATTTANSQSQSGVELRPILARMKSPHRSDELPRLFRLGDSVVYELSDELKNPDPTTRFAAQIVLRYLATPKALKALDQIDGLELTGPIPAPVGRRDYEFIRSQYLDKNFVTEALFDAAMFALVLDHSAEALSLFDHVMANARRHSIRVDERRYLEIASVGTIVAGKNLAKSVLDRVTFLSTDERSYARAEVLAFNKNKDEALIEITLDHGGMAKEWYHLVVLKSGPGWKLLSIGQVAVS